MKIKEKKIEKHLCIMCDKKQEIEHYLQERDGDIIKICSDCMMEWEEENLFCHMNYGYCNRNCQDRLIHKCNVDETDELIFGINEKFATMVEIDSLKYISLEKQEYTITNELELKGSVK